MMAPVADPQLHVATYYAYEPTPRHLFGLPFAVQNLASGATLSGLSGLRRSSSLVARRHQFWTAKVRALHALAATLPPDDLLLFLDADVVATAPHTLAQLRRVCADALREASAVCHTLYTGVDPSTGRLVLICRRLPHTA